MALPLDVAMLRQTIGFGIVAAKTLNMTTGEATKH